MSICATYHQITANVESLTHGKPKALFDLDLFECFEKLQEWGYVDFKRNYSNDRFCGQISDLYLDNEKSSVSFVFIVTDKDAENQVARNFDTNKTRIFKRDANEGADIRTNVVIKIDKCMAQMAIENKKGVTASKLIDTLNYFLRHARVDGGFGDFFVGDDPIEKYTIT